MTGDLDRLVRPENSILMARVIPGAQLVIIDGGGRPGTCGRRQSSASRLSRTFSPGSLIRLLGFTGCIRARTKARSHDTLSSAITLMTIWPSTLIKSLL